MCECFYYDMLCDVVCLRDVPRYDYQCDQNWQNFATLSIFKSVWLLVIFLTKSLTYFGKCFKLFVENGQIFNTQSSYLVTLMICLAILI